MKRIFRLPIFAGLIVMTAVLASLAPTASSRLYAQMALYYYPYGQGPYGGYGQAYAAPYPANGNMFPSHNEMFASRAYGYTGYYGYVPPAYGNRFDYGNATHIRAYGRAAYYQPSYGPVYVPFGYQNY